MDESVSNRRRRDRTRTYVGGVPTGAFDLDVDLVPHAVKDPTQVPWHTLDHRAGYLLRQVDGLRSCRDIIGASGIEPLQARTLLVELLQLGCIELSEPESAEQR